MKLLIFFIFICMMISQFSIIEIENFKSPWIEVSVQGEVENPRVLRMNRHTTIEELLLEVQLTNEADIKGLNLLQTLHQGDHIIIPKKTVEKKVSINTGSLEELMDIKGIGEVSAKAIIQYRQEIGLFQQLEDLMKVKGIGEKTFEKIKGNIEL